MLVTLAYAVFNAHLCVLYFNVFLLLLGENFSDDKEVYLKNAKREEKLCFSGLNFAQTLYDMVPERLRGEKRRRMLRAALLLTLAFYVIVLQCLPATFVGRRRDFPASCGALPGRGGNMWRRESGCFPAASAFSRPGRIVGFDPEQAFPQRSVFSAGIRRTVL